MRPSNLGRSGAPAQNSDDSSAIPRSVAVRKRPSCAVEAFKRTGLPETDDLVDICQSIIDGHVSGDELNEDDHLKLMSVFNRYRANNADDKDAQAVNSESPEDVARFIFRYLSMHNKFMMLKRTNPDDEMLNEVNEHNIFEVVRYIRKLEGEVLR